ncbi:DUF1871 family protein [Peribacillus sp. SCS-37]|uniref:DUF1871 family protein n=1 Tax=Paraperibacillus esterisolvens TaxID=3115296 RepID=UPI003905EB1B
MLNDKEAISLDQWLYEWDPLNIGADSYVTEKAEILGVLYITDNLSTIAAKIKEILEFSFDESPGAELCMNAARILVQLKNNQSCEL